MYAYSPTGSPILGTLDNCPCRAEILTDSYQRNEQGKIEYEHAGGTEMFYDDQRTQQRDGEDLYLDADGEEWKERELQLCAVELTEELRFKMAEEYASAPVPEPQRRSFKVWTAVYEHRHGMDMRVFVDKAAADEWRTDLADENWTGWFDDPEPEDRDEMARRFWEKAGESSKGEWFTVEEIEVEGIAGNPLTAEIVSAQIPYREFAAQVARFSMPEDMGTASDDDIEDNIAALAALITKARKLCPEQIGADEQGDALPRTEPPAPEIADDEREYRVTWEIDLAAANARAAALKAMTIQRDRQSTATVFECTPRDGSAPTERIDIPAPVAHAAITPSALKDARELGTVLAALRFWQGSQSGVWNHTFQQIHDEIATDGGQFESLANDEIDALCERLNLGGDEAKPTLGIVISGGSLQAVIANDATQAADALRGIVVIDYDNGEVADEDDESVYEIMQGHTKRGRRAQVVECDIEAPDIDFVGLLDTMAARQKGGDDDGQSSE